MPHSIGHISKTISGEKEVVAGRRSSDIASIWAKHAETRSCSNRVSQRFVAQRDALSPIMIALGLRLNGRTPQGTVFGASVLSMIPAAPPPISRQKSWGDAKEKPVDRLLSDSE